MQSLACLDAGLGIWEFGVVAMLFYRLHSEQHVLHNVENFVPTLGWCDSAALSSVVCKRIMLEPPTK